MSMKLNASFVLFGAMGLCANACLAQPTIVSGKIRSSVVDVTKPYASPELDLVLTGNPTNATFLLQGPSSEYFYLIFTYPPGLPAHARLRGSIPVQAATIGLATNQAFSLYTEAGTWTLVNGQVCNSDFSCSYYGSTQLSVLFPSISFQVKNPNPADMAPPFLSKGVIQTTSVSVSGKQPLTLVLTASDDVSGLASDFACAALSDGTSQFCFSSGLFYGRALTGAFPITYKLPLNTKPGTYHITSVGAYDAAGNFVNYTNPGQIAAMFIPNASFAVTP